MQTSLHEDNPKMVICYIGQHTSLTSKVNGHESSFRKWRVAFLTLKSSKDMQESTILLISDSKKPFKIQVVRQKQANPRSE